MTSLAVPACAAPTAVAVVPAAIMGGGNLDNGKLTAEVADRIAVLKSLGMTRCRINLYPGAYLRRLGQWGEPQTHQEMDALMVALHEAGIEPVILFEYYTNYYEREGFGDEAQWEAIGRVFAARYAPGGTWARESGVGDDFGVRLYTAINEPEPGDFRLGGKYGPEPYVAALRGLSRGVKGVRPTLEVAPGGFMAANAWNDYTLRGLGSALAPLFNDGTLDGIDLHTYYDVQWAPMEGGYGSSAMHDFLMFKRACGITNDMAFYSTEFNYKFRRTTREQAACGLLTGIWDHLGVVGNDGHTLWVWQNRTGWTDRLGTSVTLHGIPAKAKSVAIHNWQGQQRVVALGNPPARTLTVEGLDPGQTWMSIADAEAPVEPRELLPPDAYRIRPQLAEAELAAAAVKGIVLRQETFDAEAMEGWTLVPADSTFRGLGTLTTAEAQGADGRCAHLTLVFKKTGDSVGPATWRLQSNKFLNGVSPAEKVQCDVTVKARASRPGRMMQLYLHDADGETLVMKPQRLDPQWRTLRFDLTGGVDGHWGGSRTDGIIDWPISLFGLQLLDWGGATDHDNEQVWLDDLRLLQTTPETP